MLDALAQSQGISRQAVLMRALVTGGTDAAARYERLREELAATRFVLATVANNVNQLAHQANSFALSGHDPVTTDDVHKLAAQVRRVLGKLDEISGAVSEGPDAC